MVDVIVLRDPTEKIMSGFAESINLLRMVVIRVVAGIQYHLVGVLWECGCVHRPQDCSIGLAVDGDLLLPHRLANLIPVTSSVFRGQRRRVAWHFRVTRILDQSAITLDLVDGTSVDLLAFQFGGSLQPARLHAHNVPFFPYLFRPLGGKVRKVFSGGELVIHRRARPTGVNKQHTSAFFWFGGCGLDKANADFLAIRVGVVHGNVHPSATCARLVDVFWAVFLRNRWPFYRFGLRRNGYSSHGGKTR